MSLTERCRTLGSDGADFNDIMVLTAKPSATNRSAATAPAHPQAHRTRPIFGTKNVWRGRGKVLSRTCIARSSTCWTILRSAAVSAGCDCYRILPPSRTEDGRLVEYAERLGNGAVFKRLGFLAEAEPSAGGLVDACRKRLTGGRAKLDPALECSRVISRWKLWIPSFWEPAPG